MTQNPQTTGIVGLIGSVVTGGATWVATKDRVFDKSGYGNGGAMKNDAHIGDGQLVLDGVDDYVMGPKSKELSGVPVLTVMAEVIPEKIEGDNRCIVGFEGPTEDRNWELLVGSDGRPTFKISNGTSSEGATSPDPIPTGKKTRIAGRYREGDTLMVNGTGISRDEKTPSIDLAWRPKELSVGAFSYGKYDQFNGKISLLRIWNEWYGEPL